MNKTKLKKTLLEMNENIEALRDAINAHQHDQHGESFVNQYECVSRKLEEYEPTFKQIIKKEIKEIFKEENKRKQR